MKNLFSSNFSYNRTPALETVKISKCYKKINQSLTIYKTERRKFSLTIEMNRFQHYPEAIVNKFSVESVQFKKGYWILRRGNYSSHLLARLSFQNARRNIGKS